MEASSSLEARIVLLSVFMVIGIPGNILILRVYWIKPRKTSTHVLILGLAWTDLVSCVLLAPRIASLAGSLQGGERSLALGFIHALLVIAVCSSVMITAVIALDRYDCVCRPAKRLLSQKRAKVAVVCCAVYSAVISIPLLFRSFGIAASNNELALIYALQILSYAFSLSTVAICYWLVYGKIRQHVRVGSWVTRDRDPANQNCSNAQAVSLGQGGVSQGILLHPVPDVGSEGTKASTSGTTQNRRDAESSDACHPHQLHRAATVSSCLDRFPGSPSGLQRKTTKMLLLTSSVFMALWLPYWIYVALRLANNYGGHSANATAASFLEVPSSLLYLNSAINPFLYGVANRRFREDCKNIFKKIRN